MYINFKELKNNGLTPEELVSLCAIRQGIQLDFCFLETTLLMLKKKDLIKTIKGTKKQSDLEKTRLSEKGKKLLEKLEEIEVSEDTEVIFNWLADYYKKLGKEVGNSNKTKKWIESFSQKSGINRNNLVKLCKAFVEDDSNMNYSHKLEYLFFKPMTIYQTKFSIEDSRLYQFYLKSKDYFDNKVFTNEKD